jgi:hypothetical protein
MEEQDLANIKSPRKGIFFALFTAADEYRDYNIEVNLKSQQREDISFICEKGELTEAEKRENEELGYEEHKRGDKMYHITGFTYEQDLSNTGPNERTDILCRSIAAQFLALEKSYKENPDGTHPVMFNIRIIDNLEEYIDSHNITKIPPMQIGDFLNVVHFHYDEKKED